MNTVLARAQVREEGDVFTVRQCARQVAAAIGLDGPDQVRVATALSEISRELLSNGVTADVAFRLDADAAGLVVDVRSQEAVAGLPPAEHPGSGVAGARRLMDDLALTRDARGRLLVTMTKPCPAVTQLSARQRTRIQSELSSLTSPTPLQELRSQNEDLLMTLEDLQRKRDELLRLNAELQQTNAGVMALYGELSDEMEATNSGVLALYAEIDDRSRQLREASEAKSRFLAHLSHELRTPANSILALGALLLVDPENKLNEQQRNTVGLVRSSAADMLRMVNELLDLAKAESGRIEPKLQVVQLHSVLAQLRGTLRPLATSPLVQLVIEEPEDVATLVTDETLLVQVLRNLLDNALKFTERGTVRLRVQRTAGGGARFVVSDTGIGIGPDDRDRIFEDFYQVANPAPARRGTGLGLPYAKRLVELLGGELTVESTVGLGSSFAVELPDLGEAAEEGSRMPVKILGRVG